ncbi:MULTISPECIES: CaiB/BaiF CoA transferase family protein [Bradyrhizobium]|uniref:CoA transferase n=3 Tax=Bradyrhizobium TaxID=374 RepID=A0AAE5X861_9BRAD|nr:MULTISPECIES: CaiB/BaiF CoA-transferase family protein [Bradyrhizobium]MCG2629345.1 CoA transferase [Bradyrhizobium zhengyangense]MCG2644626.1 CoA transferase [Bradyrhizobium zhengyangense]MCG2670859.1 CoA transferase [Bradyrhizobium zhengyangense]MDN4984492.1 CaiB/BaiF CoA-transferase family protein [Bradyrhizobium sp. WYCCWR 13022]MDN5002484.1 CaiB/BaiF CoA-transferase family protein [Bradyrhizobium sp. WYCCWR 12677]
MTRPLDGVLVIAIEQAIAAPYCTRQLADLGARVIKIERPDGGDFARAYDTRARGLASHFVWTNRSKESVTFDLKRPGALEAVQRLIAHADVFVQNLAPGAAARLGLADGVLRSTYKQLITCNISGYGPNGPWEKRKAYDLLIQAEAGFLSTTGTPDAVAKAGISIADIAAGTMAFQGILACLLRRAKSGQGDHVEVSMLEAMVEWMGYPLYYAMDGAQPPARAGAGHATIFPYGPYETADGMVLFGLQNDREWAAFTTIVLQRPEWASEARFKGNAGRMKERAEIDAVICDTFRKLPSNEAISRLETAGIGTARVNDMSAVWDHPQLRSRKRWAYIETPAGPMPSLRPISGESWQPRMDPVPSLGQHTEAVLKEFGLTEFRES